MIAVVLSAVAAAVTITLTELAYKNLLLSSAAKESQYAFYAADSALECALYWDNGASGHKKFSFNASPASPSGVACPTDSGSAIAFTASYDSGNNRTIYQSSGWFPVNNGQCATLSIYKLGAPDAQENTTYMYANGVDVPCTELSNPRAIERGLKASY